MGAETEIDARHVVGGITLARDAAQQHEATAETQFVAQATEERPERGQRKGLGVMAGKSSSPCSRRQERAASISSTSAADSV